MTGLGGLSWLFKRLFIEEFHTNSTWLNSSQSWRHRDKPLQTLQLQHHQQFDRKSLFASRLLTVTKPSFHYKSHESATFAITMSARSLELPSSLSINSKSIGHNLDECYQEHQRRDRNKTEIDLQPRCYHDKTSQSDSDFEMLQLLWLSWCLIFWLHFSETLVLQGPIHVVSFQDLILPSHTVGIPSNPAYSAKLTTVFEENYTVRHISQNPAMIRAELFPPMNWQNPQPCIWSTIHHVFLI